MLRCSGRPGRYCALPFYAGFGQTCVAGASLLNLVKRHWLLLACPCEHRDALPCFAPHGPKHWACAQALVDGHAHAQALITVSNHVAALDDPLVVSALLPPGALGRPQALRWTMCATDRCFRTRAAAAFFRAGKAGSRALHHPAVLVLLLTGVQSAAQPGLQAEAGAHGSAGLLPAECDAACKALTQPGGHQNSHLSRSSCASHHCACASICLLSL